MNGIDTGKPTPLDPAQKICGETIKAPSFPNGSVGNPAASRGSTRGNPKPLDPAQKICGETIKAPVIPEWLRAPSFPISEIGNL